MRKSYLKKTVLLLVLTTFLASTLFNVLAFAAEEEASFKTLNASIKPEFDKEQKLFVMFEGELADGTKLPSKVSFYAPKDIVDDESLEFCAVNAQGEMLCQVREKNAEGIYMKFNGPMPENKFMFEGYSPGIKDDGGKKSFTYSFKAAQDIEELNIAMAQPKGASDYKINPPAKSTSADNDGLDNFLYTFKDVKKGKEYSFKVNYVKEGWDISVEPKSNTQTPTQDSGGGSGVSALTIILSVIGAAVIAGGIVFAFVKSGQGGGGGTGGGRPTPVAPKGKARFCSNCGSRLTSGKFCPNCGAKT